MALILAGATLGFLIYNWHPASIFMGGLRCLVLGFIISAISLPGFKKFNDHDTGTSYFDIGSTKLLIH